MQWRHDLAASYTAMGEVLKAQAKPDEALKAYRDGLRVAAADRSNRLWQRGLWLSHNRIGSVLMAQDKLDEAFTAYGDGFAIAEGLVAADGSNSLWPRPRIQLWENMASSY